MSNVISGNKEVDFVRPIFDLEALERRVSDDRHGVFFLTAKAETQRRLLTDLARDVAGDLLVDVDEEARPFRPDAVTAHLRGFTVAVLRVETPAQVLECEMALRRARKRNRAVILVAHPSWVAVPLGALASWVHEENVVSLVKES